MGFLDMLMGNSTAKTKELLDQGAIVIDVRTPGEYANGHVKGSKNMPLQSFGQKIDSIKKMNKPVVLCCASGARSGQATGMLKQAGVEALNGGPWTSVQSLLK